MNTLRERLIRDFPIKGDQIAERIIDAIADLPPEQRTQRMDELSMTYIRSGLPNPFNQRVREAILDGELTQVEEEIEE